MARYCAAIAEYTRAQQRQGVHFAFGDCSLGNLFFAGCFLENGRDFNRTIAEFSRFCGARGRVLNVTDGENLVLVGLKEDGTFLKNEAELVSPQHAARIAEIFLLPRYLAPHEADELASKSPEAAIALLREHSKFPALNPLAAEAVLGADILIYGPGTQHSSLLPSYFTRGLGDAIAANTSAEKIFVANIVKDHEIQNETANSLTDKLLYYLNCKGQSAFRWDQVISRFFFHASDEALALEAKGGRYVPFSQETFRFPIERVTLIDWEVRDGVHLGGRVADELISLVNARLQRKVKPYRYMVSIVVPALNENRTVKRVLHELTLLDFQSLGLGKEIIFVDGGSTDGTYQQALTEQEVKCFQLSGRTGRGRALRLGIEKASGDMIVFFPSDAEYDPKDIAQLVGAMASSEFRVAFGSRAIKCVDLSQRIREIYRGNRLGYLISKYGGMLISIVCLLLYNRFLSDAFTSIKAFDARLLRGLNLRSNGVDLEMEIIAKLGRQSVFILELPVDFFPRRKEEGKKTTVWDGIQALVALIRFRWG